MFPTNTGLDYTIAFRKCNEIGLCTAIRPYIANIASALHSSRCSNCITIYVHPPPLPTSPRHSIFTCNVVIATRDDGIPGRNFSPSIFAVFQRISRYITPAESECIQNAEIHLRKYSTSILSLSISVT